MQSPINQAVHVKSHEPGPYMFALNHSDKTSFSKLLPNQIFPDSITPNGEDISSSEQAKDETLQRFQGGEIAGTTNEDYAKSSVPFNKRPLNMRASASIMQTSKSGKGKHKVSKSINQRSSLNQSEIISTRI